jgi:hypothetical protein
MNKSANAFFTCPEQGRYLHKSRNSAGSRRMTGLGMTDCRPLFSLNFRNLNGRINILTVVASLAL